MPDARKPPHATVGTETEAASSLLRGLLTPAAPAPTPRSRPGIPVPGEIIAGKYAVEEILGEGGMGVVLAARHAQLGQRVAIKFLIGQAASDANAVARFLREARAAAVLSSEHIAKVHDVGTLETGEPYLVMEYLAGADLGEILRRLGTIAVVDAVSAVLQACEGLAEAHVRGIIHRDLKPSNLFVTKRMDGTPLVKVLDFGISKMTEGGFDDKQSLTASGLVMGSPLYMSPEQIRSSRDVDVRSDVWALGVILYELLTGMPPFAGETMGETLAKIFSETPAPLRSLRPEVPEELAAVIGQCLERDLRLRLQNVGELASRLLPFASRSDAVSVERILRVSGVPAPPSARQQGAFTAGPTMESPPFVAGSPSDPTPRPQRQGTEPPWLRSASNAQATPKTGRTVAIAATVALLLGATVTGAYVMRVRSQTIPSLPSATKAAEVSQTPPPAPAPAPVRPPPVASSAAPAPEPSSPPAATTVPAAPASPRPSPHTPPARPSPIARPPAAPPPSPTASATTPAAPPPAPPPPAPSPAPAPKGPADPLGIKPE